MYRRSLRETVFPRLTQFLFKRGNTELKVILDATNQIQETPEAASDPPAVNLIEEVPNIEDKTSDQHFSDMFNLLFDSRDLEKGEAAFQKLQSSTGDETSKLRNEILYYWLRFRAGDSNALANLKSLLERGRLQEVIHFYVGICYENSNDFAAAADAYVASAESSESTTRASSLIAAARCQYKNNQKNEALSLLMTELATINNDESQYIIYKGLAAIYELEDEDLLRAVALEKALEFKPNETEVLFSAGYAYRKSDQHLALLHYKTLIRFAPENAMALNNLGAAYEELGMPLKAVSFYRQARSLGNTLSAANLAYRFMNAGFSDEASSILSEAQKSDNVHANVASAMAAISKKADSEASDGKRVLELARERQRFIVSFANAYFRSSDGSAFKGVWTDKSGIEITIEQVAQQISATWVDSYITYTLTGEACNLGAKIILKGKTSTGLLDTEQRGLIYISADRDEIMCMLYKAQKVEVSSFKKKH